MKDISSIESLVVPEGVTVAIKARTVTVEGPRGKLTKNVGHIQMDIQLVKTAKNSKVVFTVWHGARKHVACLRTVKSMVENMITGVTKGFLYKMRLVYAHFPINALPNDDGSALQIRNFLGEKFVRDCPMLEGVKVSLSDVKDELIIQGNDIEKVSQSAASITDKCRVKDKDIRKFLDGVYISERTVVVKDE
ncbi:50S small subunit ribosomal protein L9e [Cryptococcus deuterogattii 99/473]|uniref:50S small subunit ribosomal protein L9e n=2 Tax=Cryptococcus deuterogattii TaxID=1859096 RepID=A0A0D0V7F3_9TREE|nr:50S small subunit ribosomal protein L9e [Cryptococcus deuterogattii R265]KIR27232.1 50S small subunit ribosomal protein L9e [Cryptococcus deuterogattii LA55]KIR33598.1 50S small subunit ribosomal protein L9e [Cryptococcus deuterogattii MMRL2647]KIR40850.1 50S small subunit ribosomal protein L9e [Cryptococcus deuterogattii Ram5]KIR74531.1 50S small subunit ribosomal protein L9e [Cryptococcus deuterogattii CA1014]KIR93980.1 50S small subunit ribosomal protein L9e [Cryptococcus deuterogattii C